MKIQILIVFLFLIPYQLIGQSDSLTSWIEFVDPLGCKNQLQSFNPNISIKDLDNLMSILNIPSTDRGLRKEFLMGVYFDIQPSRNRSYYKSFSDSSYQAFKNSCLKLKSIDIPMEFNELRDSILVNYLKRLSYENVVRGWIADNNYPKFKSHIESLLTNNDIKSILESIEDQNGFHDKLRIIQFSLYNHLNETYFPFSTIKNTEDRLLNKYNLTLVSEKCED